MHLVYIDESGTFNDGSFSSKGFWTPLSVRESTHFVVSCLIVDANNWKSSFARLKKLRKNIKETHDIPISEFLHATELVAGLDKWKHVSRTNFDRPKRVKLLKFMLHEYGQWGELKTISVVVNKSGKKFPSINPSTCRKLAYENLLNRIERTVGDQYLIIHDGVEDLVIIRMLRKMQVYNMINKINIPIKNIIEDPLFKRGAHSYFLQAIDYIAYSVLHMVDIRSNADISSFIEESKILKRIGVCEACRSTADKFPGIVPIPTPSAKKNS